MTTALAVLAFLLSVAHFFAISALGRKLGKTIEAVNACTTYIDKVEAAAERALNARALQRDPFSQEAIEESRRA